MTAQTAGSYDREPVMTETTRRLARQVTTYRRRASAAHSREFNQRMAYKHLLRRLCSAVGVSFKHPPSWEYDQVADRIVAEALRLRAERAERKVVTPEQHDELAATVYGVLRHADHADGERLCAEVAQAVLKAGWHR